MEKYDWDRLHRRLLRCGSGETAEGGDHRHPPGDQVRRMRRRLAAQPCRPQLDRHVPTFDMASFQ
jgi:hypothetical protein